MARRRHRHRWRWLIWLAAALLGLVVVYLALSPLAVVWALSAFPSREALRIADIDEQIRQAALAVFLAAWTFMFGAAVGSFLNVVAWRMPRGESIVSRPSHCPYCNANIRARDNLPVFGWLLLGGRCRTCRLPISPRYPIVEAIMGTAFLALAVAEVFTAGTNLPGYAPPRPFYGLSSIVTSPDWPLLAVFGYHCLLLGLLAAVALVKFDRHALPWKLTAVAIALGLAGPALWPGVHPVAWTANRPAWLAARPWLARIDTSLVGLAAGLLMGILIDAFVRRTFAQRELERRTWTASAASLAVVGLFLGWQALVSAALLGAAVAVAVTAVGQAIRFVNRLPLTACWALGALLQLCCWRMLDGLVWWPGSSTSWPGMLLAFVFPLALVLACARFVRRWPSLDNDEPIDSDSSAGRAAEDLRSSQAHGEAVVEERMDEAAEARPHIAADASADTDHESEREEEAPAEPQRGRE